MLSLHLQGFARHPHGVERRRDRKGARGVLLLLYFVEQLAVGAHHEVAGRAHRELVVCEVRVELAERVVGKAREGPVALELGELGKPLRDAEEVFGVAAAREHGGQGGRRTRSRFGSVSPGASGLASGTESWVKSPFTSSRRARCSASTPVDGQGRDFERARLCEALAAHAAAGLAHEDAVAVAKGVQVQMEHQLGERHDARVREVDPDAALNLVLCGIERGLDLRSAASAAVRPPPSTSSRAP